MRVGRGIIALVIQPKERRQDSGPPVDFKEETYINEYSSVNTTARSLEQQRHKLQLDIGLI